MSSQIAHYDRLADRFNDHWTYSPQFVTWMSRCVTNRLNPQPGERALDLGCGTGLYTRSLAHHTGTVTCVDPSEKMLQRLPEDRAFTPVRATAEDLIDRTAPLPFEQYDTILAKEIVHHIPRTVRSHVLHGITEMLATNGRLLFILTPPTIDHPLFDAALRRYKQHPIDPTQIARILEAAGLHVTVDTESFPLELRKERWLTMIRDRYMSLLTKFNNQELEAGITEINNRYPEPLIRFHDRYILILGRLT